MLSSDHYAVLGVAPDADADAIEGAYRHLCRRYHPDLNPADSRALAAFDRITLAYAVLSDPDERARYDRLGRSLADVAELAPGQAGPIALGPPARGGQSYRELFRALREHARRAEPQRGGDVHVTVATRLLDAERGRRTTAELRRLIPCPRCQGRGRDAARYINHCGRCGGSGKEAFGHGALSLTLACAECGGEGFHVGLSCQECNGSGLVGRAETVAVQIPPGVVDGQVVRVAGGGHHGARGGPAGDLVVTCRVLGDPRFERNGPHLRSQVRISVSEAILGGRVDVPLPGGRTATLRVPPGTQNGTELRLRGQGLEMDDGRRGDLLAVVEVWVPPFVDEDAKRLIREFGERTPAPPRSPSERATVQR